VCDKLQLAIETERSNLQRLRLAQPSRSKRNQEQARARSARAYLVSTTQLVTFGAVFGREKGVRKLLASYSQKGEKGTCQHILCDKKLRQRNWVQYSFDNRNEVADSRAAEIRPTGAERGEHLAAYFNGRPGYKPARKLVIL